jgi:hypothetical protein
MPKQIDRNTLIALTVGIAALVAVYALSNPDQRADLLTIAGSIVAGAMALTNALFKGSEPLSDGVPTSPQTPRSKADAHTSAASRTNVRK